MEPILKIEDLSIDYSSETQSVHALRAVSLSVHEGECIAVVGESGSGKSTLASTVMGCRNGGSSQGRIFYKGRDLLSMPKKEFDALRWTEIAMVFQNSLDILNPVLSVGEQIAECLRKHRKLKADEAGRETLSVLSRVHLESSVADLLPYQLSGGMRQRVLLAMAVCCRPKLLLADEPTSAVDEENKKALIALLRELREELGLTLVLVTHELETAGALADRFAVFYGGCLFELGTREMILQKSRHPYTRGLLTACPPLHPNRDLWGIAEDDGSGNEQGCPFYGRCPQRQEQCLASLPALRSLGEGHSLACHRGGILSLMQVRELSLAFQNGDQTVRACDRCSFELYTGEIIAVLGKSGAGKSTLARLCAGLQEPDHGGALFDGENVRKAWVCARRGGIQLILQDPFSSVNGALSVEKALSEPLRITKQTASLRETLRELLRSVGLSADDSFLSRQCSTLSGGQRQRLSIARALSMEPRLLIADEICSMLDSSTQANLLRLLKGLQQKRGLTVLFITHDRLLAEKVADRVFELADGRLTERD